MSNSQYRRRHLGRWILALLVVVPLCFFGAVAIAKNTVMKRIEQKAARAQQLVKQRMEEGHAPLEQVAKLKTVPELGKQGKANESKERKGKVEARRCKGSTPNLKGWG